MKICSLLPTSTEMLYALGLGRSVVGRSEHCLWPAAVQKKPIVVRSAAKKVARQDALAIHKAVLQLQKENRHQFVIDQKTMKRLQPDLVVTQTLCNVCAASHEEVDEAIKAIEPKPQVVSVLATNLSGVYQDFKRLGKATGTTPAAQKVVKNLKQQISSVQKRVKKTGTRPRVWCCEWLEPLMAAGHWIPELVELAGGQDGLGKSGGNSRWLNWEQIQHYNPEVILVMPCSYSVRQSLQESWRLTQRPGWKKISAVQSGQVYAIDTSYFHHAGPRLAQGVDFLADLIHPELKTNRAYRGMFRRLA